MTGAKGLCEGRRDDKVMGCQAMGLREHSNSLNLPCIGAIGNLSRPGQLEPICQERIKGKSLGLDTNGTRLTKEMQRA